jgi:hypothetical protein
LPLCRQARSDRQVGVRIYRHAIDIWALATRRTSPAHSGKLASSRYLPPCHTRKGGKWHEGSLAVAVEDAS